MEALLRLTLGPFSSWERGTCHSACGLNPSCCTCALLTSTSPWAPSSVSGEKSAGLLGAFRGTNFGLFSLYSKPHYKGALALGFLC